ncbi:hypothetical protein ACN6MT_11275 [Neobacillus niacini]|uniref:hypothetical protein n=1 Tax=Neobacillus niacini TaxID=86668 RepID=UPI003B013578
MRKAIIKTPSDNEIKVAASDFSIEIHHKGRPVVNLSKTAYTYEDVFEYIKDEYEEDLDTIQKIVITLDR